MEDNWLQDLLDEIDDYGYLDKTEMREELEIVLLIADRKKGDPFKIYKEIQTLGLTNEEIKENLNK